MPGSGRPLLLGVTAVLGAAFGAEGEEKAPGCLPFLLGLEDVCLPPEWEAMVRV